MERKDNIMYISKCCEAEIIEDSNCYKCSEKAEVSKEVKDERRNLVK